LVSEFAHHRGMLSVLDLDPTLRTASPVEAMVTSHSPPVEIAGTRPKPRGRIGDKAYRDR